MRRRSSSLLDELVPIYTTACNDSAQERWHTAQEGFKKALQLVDDQTNSFNINVQKHLAYARGRAAEERRSKSPLFGG